MCLAVPAKIIALEGDLAEVELNGNRLKVCTLVVPEARTGDWVLVHAGFAITRLDEEQARQSWQTIREIADDDRLE